MQARKLAGSKRPQSEDFAQTIQERNKEGSATSDERDHPKSAHVHLPRVVWGSKLPSVHAPPDEEQLAAVRQGQQANRLVR